MEELEFKVRQVVTFEASLGCTARARLRIMGKSWRNCPIAFCVTSYVSFIFFN